MQQKILKLWSQLTDGTMLKSRVSTQFLQQFLQCIRNKRNPEAILAIRVLSNLNQIMIFKLRQVGVQCHLTAYQKALAAFCIQATDRHT